MMLYRLNDHKMAGSEEKNDEEVTAETEARIQKEVHTAEGKVTGKKFDLKTGE